MSATLAPVTVVAASERELIDDFCDQVWLQDGLAPASLAGYRQDLGAWAAWLAQHGKSLHQAQRADVEGYIGAQFKRAAKVASINRRLSSLRRFYQLQLQRGALTTPLKVGDSVEAKDRIMTDGMGSVGITLSDDTLISVGPRSALTIEEFAFNPTTQAGALGVNVVSGTLRMVTGLIARQSPSAVRINTPNAAVGVRGTDFIVEVPAP